MTNDSLAKIQTDPRSTDELTTLLLSLDNEENEYFDTLKVLHFRGTREVLDSARALCRSTIPNERMVGVDILRKQGESVRLLREAREYLASTLPGADRYEGARERYASVVEQLSDVIGDAREYSEEAISELLSMLADEYDSRVLQNVVTALGWYRDDQPLVLEQLIACIHHPDSDVRHALAMSLAVNHPAAIEALIALSVDADADVRDRATFELAQLSDDGWTLVDLPQIRDALYARVHDEDNIVRYEALRGLASRGDARVIEPLIAEPFEAEANGTLVEALIDAGKIIGDPRLLPALLWLKEHGLTCGDNHYDMSEDDDLLEAIAHCLPEAC